MSAAPKFSEKFHASISDALLKACLRKDVEVRVTFDDVDEALESCRLFISTLEALGNFDREKSLAHPGPAAIIELTNGSCIVLLYADKVWIKDHWVKLLREKQLP